MRNVIFISHASPEDNDFSIWLASRLQMSGYDAWIDRNVLLGGEKFWEEIDQIIRHKAAKFLLVYSKNICTEKQPGQLKDGIYKEYSLAESVSRQENLKDFIILLNIDSSNYNLFIGADRLTQIPFYENWADGLKQLIKKLEKDSVERSDKSRECAIFAHWYGNEYTTKNGIVPKNEMYYSSWWPIRNLPEYFYMVQFESKYDAQMISGGENPYPVGRIANVISTFDQDISSEVERNGKKYTLDPKAKYKIKITDVLDGFEKVDFPTHRDAEVHLKWLLSRVFHQIMKNRDMFWYELANRGLAYFYIPANLTSSKVSFRYPVRRNGKKTTKNLIGKYRSLGKWHFAVSSKPMLSPFIGYSLKTHIIFTEDGFKVWEDKNKMHTHRRTKAKRFFNKQWRDMLFAFLHGLQGKERKIELPLNSRDSLNLEPWTASYWAEFGYYEPKEKSRQGILSEYSEHEEFLLKGDELMEEQEAG
jgi:hypothetical protein